MLITLKYLSDNPNVSVITGSLLPGGNRSPGSPLGFCDSWRGRGSSLLISGVGGEEFWLPTRPPGITPWLGGVDVPPLALWRWMQGLYPPDGDEGSLLGIVGTPPQWGGGHLVIAWQGEKSWLPTQPWLERMGTGLQCFLWCLAAVEQLLSRSFLFSWPAPFLCLCLDTAGFYCGFFFGLCPLVFWVANFFSSKSQMYLAKWKPRGLIAVSFFGSWIPKKSKE